MRPSRANRALAAAIRVEAGQQPRERQSLVDAISGRARPRPERLVSRANQSRPSALDAGVIEDDLTPVFPRSGPSFHYYELGDLGEQEAVC
jgi:hypothetical protein